MGADMFARYLPDGERRPLPASAVIRRAAAGDIDACALLAAARNGGDVAMWTSRLRARLAVRDSALMVADVGEVVGYGHVAWFAAPHGAPGNAAPTGYYLLGMLVVPRWRRCGLGNLLTAARLDWVWKRAAECWYFANVSNRASLDLHAGLGFHEVTRDFWFPGVTFDGGEGVLSRAVPPGGFAL